MIQLKTTFAGSVLDHVDGWPCRCLLPLSVIHHPWTENKLVSAAGFCQRRECCASKNFMYPKNILTVDGFQPAQYNGDLKRGDVCR
jgi:hypothetical protein